MRRGDRVLELSRVRRRTSTAAEALSCKRLPRRQRRRDGRGLERALASTRHGQSLRRRDVLWHGSAPSEKTQADYVGGKEGVDGSSPSEGFRFSPAMSCFGW